MGRILTVRFSDFKDDFDDTTRRMFRHFLGREGPDAGKVETLVAAAAAEDVGKWTKDSVAGNDHVAASDRKREVRATFALLRKSRDAEVMRLIKDLAKVKEELELEAEFEDV